MNGAGHHGAQSLTKMCIRPNGNRLKTSSVKRPVIRQRFPFSGVQLGQHDRHFDGFRSSRAKQHPIESLWRDLDQFFGQFHGGQVGETPGRKGQGLRNLFLDGRNDLGVVVPHGMYAIAVQVEVFFTFPVVDVSAFGFGHDIKNGGGEGLVEKKPAVSGNEFIREVGVGRFGAQGTDAFTLVDGIWHGGLGFEG